MKNINILNCLRKHRDTSCSLCRYETEIPRYREPRALITDKCAATIIAVNKLRNESLLKYLGFQSISSAATIQGIEVVNFLYKKIEEQ